MKEVIKYLAKREGWINLFTEYVNALKEEVMKTEGTLTSIGYYKKFYEKLKPIQNEYKVSPRKDFDK